MEEKKQGGGGLGVGLDINLRLGEIQNTVTQLTEALQSAGGKLTQNVTGLIRKIQESAPQLQQASRQEGGQGQATSLLNRLVAQLQEAANRGEEEARKLLGELGQKTQAAGRQMEEQAGRGQSEPRRQ